MKIFRLRKQVGSLPSIPDASPSPRGLTIEGEDTVHMYWGGDRSFVCFSRIASKESKGASLWLPFRAT